jgi:hypothetical protein
MLYIDFLHFLAVVRDQQVSSRVDFVARHRRIAAKTRSGSNLSGDVSFKKGIASS